MVQHSRSHKLEEYLAQKNQEAGGYTDVIPVRFTSEQKVLIRKYSIQEYGKENASKFVRDYMEKHLFKMHPTEKTLIEQKD